MQTILFIKVIDRKNYTLYDETILTILTTNIYKNIQESKGYGRYNSLSHVFVCY